MRLFVSLTREEFDALAELARAERRRPQDQAAALLARALGGRARAGVERPAGPMATRAVAAETPTGAAGDGDGDAAA